jgi:hypothetical protein
MTHPEQLRRAVGFRRWIVAGAVIGVLGLTSARIGFPVVAPAASAQPRPDTGAIYVTEIPAGYRNWTLISVAAVGNPLNDIRAKLGNQVAIGAFRDRKIPYPEGTTIARLAWKQDTSAVNNNVFRRALAGKVSPDALEKLLAGSFVAGPATNVQFMIKDSKKYAPTGGWGYGQFTNSKADTGAVMKGCFPCHALAPKDRDFVFTTYSH